MYFIVFLTLTLYGCSLLYYPINQQTSQTTNDFSTTETTGKTSGTSGLNNQKEVEKLIEVELQKQINDHNFEITYYELTDKKYVPIDLSLKPKSLELITACIHKDEYEKLQINILFQNDEGRKENWEAYRTEKNLEKYLEKEAERRKNHINDYEIATIVITARSLDGIGSERPFITKARQIGALVGANLICIEDTVVHKNTERYISSTLTLHRIEKGDVVLQSPDILPRVYFNNIETKNNKNKQEEK